MTSDNLRQAALAVDRARVLLAPDRRTTVFDVSATGDDGAITLEGVVERSDQHDRLVEAVDRAVASEVQSSVTVLEGTETTDTTSERVLPIRGSPDAEAEQVTQVLYGAQLTAYDVDGAFRRVRTPDGYVGWARNDCLECPDESEWTPTAVTVAPVDTGLEFAVPAGVSCRVLEEAWPGGSKAETVDVQFRTGETATIPGPFLQSTALGDPATVVETAKRFLEAETPYEWGGMTETGIDCSGLVWIAYRAVGVTMPRDADQQRAIGTDVDREELAPGDLLFFPGHVAISLGGPRYIHAYGSAAAVTINSLDPTADNYVESLEGGLEKTTRVIDA